MKNNNNKSALERNKEKFANLDTPEINAALKRMEQTQKPIKEVSSLFDEKGRPIPGIVKFKGKLYCSGYQIR